MKHKHAEVIKAFVDGKECEYWSHGYGNWMPIIELSEFDFDDVRIKPYPQQESEPQYLYVYNNMNTSKTCMFPVLMPERKWIYMGKVRVEK